MKKYVSTVIKTVKDANLFAPQGGPIILAQVLIIYQEEIYVIIKIEENIIVKLTLKIKRIWREILVDRYNKTLNCYELKAF